MNGYPLEAQPWMWLLDLSRLLLPLTGTTSEPAAIGLAGGNCDVDAVDVNEAIELDLLSRFIFFVPEVFTEQASTE